MNLQQHPLSAAFPAMSDDDFQALKDDISVNGQREPVMIFEGMVLDGWHRYRACIELGLKPKQFNFDSNDDPVAFVKSQNLHRRHLTASQRAAAVVACFAWHPAHRPNKSVLGTDLLKKSTDLARDASVSVRTVEHAKAASRAGLIDAVRDGALTAKEAAQIATNAAAKPPKATPAPTPAPIPAPQDDGPSEAELMAAQQAEQDDRDAVQRLLDADDKMAALMAENKQLRAMNRVLEERNNGLMNEKEEILRMLKAAKRKLDRLQKEGATA